MIDWLIIGGGIHGTYISNVLTAQLKISPDDVRVLDPHQKPLTVWHHHTKNCGMRYLRSPATHNIDLGIMSIHHYAKLSNGKPHAYFIPPYYRPSLNLFNRHCAHVIETNRLKDLRINGRANALKKLGSVIGVETSDGLLKARKIILAIGVNEQPCWPDWAFRSQAEGAKIHHLFDLSFSTKNLVNQSKTVILGGGISAVQTALKLSSEHQGEVILVSRHLPKQSAYDFDPCWIGPKCLRGFNDHPYVKRRKIIDQARIRGSAPPEVLSEFRKATQSGKLKMETASHISAALKNNRILLKLDEKQIWADQIVLATGFLPVRPGGTFVKQVIEEFDLRYNDCGYPIVGEDLRWHDRIFVMGPLAELQVGPCARNIVGARNAGRLLVRHLKD